MNQVRIGKSRSDHLQSLEGKDASLMTWCTMLLPGQVRKTGLLSGFHEMYRAGRPLAFQRAKQRQYSKTVWVLSLTIDVHLYQVNRSEFNKVAPAKVPQQLCRGWKTKDLRLWKPASKCEQLAVADSFGDLSWSKRAKQPNSIMIPCPPFSPLSIRMNDWHLDEFFGRCWRLAYCFRCSAIADPVVFLRCFLSPFCMYHHEEQQAEVASSLSRTHGIEMKAASMKWISLLRKSHTNWFGLTFSTVTRKKKQNAGSTSKAKAYVLFVRIGSICTWRPWRKPNQIRCFSSLAPSIKSLCMEPLLLCD